MHNTVYSGRFDGGKPGYSQSDHASLGYQALDARCVDPGGGVEMRTMTPVFLGCQFGADFDTLLEAVVTEQDYRFFLQNRTSD